MGCQDFIKIVSGMDEILSMLKNQVYICNVPIGTLPIRGDYS